MSADTVSIVIPVYNEEACIRELASRMDATLKGFDEQLVAEVIFVDDHSIDRSPDLLKEVCTRVAGFRFLRLSRNSGSHVAILAGLEHSRGDCAVFLAADLQDPPELIQKMVDAWRQGSKVVWAVRERREGVSWSTRFFSRSFYWLLNHLGQVDLPPAGSDFALLDRAALNALLQSVGANPSLGGEIARLGFRQTEILYTKQARKLGRSKSDLRRKLKWFSDAFVSFSYAPMRAMSYLGMGSSIAGFLYASYVLAMRLFVGHSVPGYPSIIIAILVTGGIQMIMLGVLGEYVWRTLDEARRRPRYFIENSSEHQETGETRSMATGKQC